MKEMEEMKGELKTVVKEGKRGRHRFRSCGFIALAIIFTLSAYLIWTVASTGLVQIPLLTNLTFHSSTLVREVSLGVPFNSALSKQTVAGQIHLSEGTLTTFLQDQLSTRSQNFFESKGAQILLTKSDGIELSLPIRDNELGSTVVVKFEMDIQEGAITLNLLSASLGSWNVPNVLLQGVLAPFLTTGTTELNTLLKDVCTPTSIAQQEGSLTLICKT